MNTKTKAFLCYFLIFFVIFQGIWWTLDYFFPEVSGLYRAAISGGLSGFLTPQFNSVDTGTAEKIRVNWIFSKKPFFIR